jgi:hypothetical protein
MIRVRFYVNLEDPRPLNSPKHPYWITGSLGIDTDITIIVSYADNLDELKQNWPEAEHIDILEDGVESYSFSDRFPKPRWFKG